MRLEEYLAFLGAKIRIGEDAVDVPECVRLARVGMRALDQYILKCEQGDHPTKGNVDVLDRCSKHPDATHELICTACQAEEAEDVAADLGRETKP